MHKQLHSCQHLNLGDGFVQKRDLSDITYVIFVAIVGGCKVDRALNHLVARV